MKCDWIYIPEKELVCRYDDRVLWRYSLRRDLPKTFFHPVCTPAGFLMTGCQPHDHVWHYGLWFSWKFMNGINMWDRPENPDCADPEGYIQITRETVHLSGGQARIILDLSYFSADGEALAEETRTVCFGGLREDSSYTLDWAIETKAPKNLDLELSATPLSVWYGGYSGLAYRTTRGMVMQEPKAHDSHGQINTAIHHQSSKWVDFAAQTDGSRDHMAGVAILEHHENVRYPNHWWFGKDSGQGFLNTSVAFGKPLLIRRGERLALGYRVLVHDGERSQDDLNRELGNYQSQSR